jgi:hypothetical protein
MISNNLVDIEENDIIKSDKELLSILLKDNNTMHNIIWATDNYEQLGDGYSFSDYIQIPLITGANGNVIQPRVSKDKETQLKRVRDKAEVFTPCVDMQYAEQPCGRSLVRKKRCVQQGNR